MKGGAIGSGGLGDVAARLATAMGADVSVFSRAAEILDDAAGSGIVGVLGSDKCSMASRKADHAR